MKIVVFLGPTLPLADARDILDAVYLPPIEQGGLISALSNHAPDVVAIIDGSFMQTLAVWHKEILFALDRGVRVYGASSMGALRAAETAVFGMQGVGEVYRQFAAGELVDDDEVAVAHGPVETGYAPVTDAMVNIRATLCAACERGVVDNTELARIVGLAKATYFPLRTFDYILDLAEANGVAVEKVARLRVFVREEAVDLKRRDAVQLLTMLRDLDLHAAESLPKFDLKKTIYFLTLNERDRFLERDGVEISLASISSYCAVQMPDFAEVNFDALNRSLVRFLADILGVQVGPDEVEEEKARFRRRRSIGDDRPFEEWLRRNDLSNEDFEQSMKGVAVCRRLHKWLLVGRSAMGTTQLLLDELRLKGRYEEWADRATLAEFVIKRQYRGFASLVGDGADFQELVDDHLAHGGDFDGLDVESWSAEAGFPKVMDLHVELLRSKLFRTYLERLDLALGGDGGAAGDERLDKTLTP